MTTFGGHCFTPLVLKDGTWGFPKGGHRLVVIMWSIYSIFSGLWVHEASVRSLGYYIQGRRQGVTSGG